MPLAADLCSLCNGSGLLLEVDPAGERYARECGCRKARQLGQRLLRANIPKRHEHSTLQNYESVIPGAGDSGVTRGDSLLNAHYRANQFVLDYPVETGGRGLLFVGLSGRGKTHLAVGILRALIEEKGVQGLFCDYGDLLKQIQNSYSAKAQATELELLRPVFEAEVLVLDDLGSTKPTAWVWDTVAHILNKRYNDQRTTIVTTNFADRGPSLSGAVSVREDTLGDRIGERMRSRLSEMCVTVELRGEDFRQTEGRARFAWSDAEGPV